LRLSARSLIVVVVMLGVGALAPSPAAAEPSGTVSVMVGPETWVGHPSSITVSGTSSQAGELAAYMFEGSSPCPSVRRKDEVVLAPVGPPTPVSAGSYSQTYGFTPNSAGMYVVCGYLYDPSSSDTIYVAGTGSFNATVHSEIAPGGTIGNTGSATVPASTEPAPPPHLTTLRVKVRDHQGHTTAKPGHTDIVIQTGGATDVTDESVFDVRFTLKRNGRRQAEAPIWSSGSSAEVVVPWSCRQPGGVYSYTVTAKDSYGKSLTRHGKFHPVSAARCRALKAADVRRRQQEAAARPREEREEERREREEAPRRKAQEDQEKYCEHVLGGYPLEVEGEGPVVTDCEVGRLVYILTGDPPKIVTVRERQ
jgi:hypothetical protein